jgi:surfactin synthase thioesterase subunit
MFAGDHFFIKGAKTELLQAISDDLARIDITSVAP